MLLNRCDVCKVWVALLCIGVAVCTEPACPDYCACKFDTKFCDFIEYTCNVDSVNITIGKYCDQWIVTMNCSVPNPNVNCSHYSNYNLPIDEPTIEMLNCPLDLLNCLDNIVHHTTVKTLTLYNMTPTAEYVTNFKNVEYLTYAQAENETNLSFDFISALPALTKLNLLKSNLQLSAENYQFASLIDLEISEGNFTNIPQDFFKGMSQIRRLQINSNLYMNNINATTFKGLDLLQTLKFDMNSLKTIEPGTFDRTPKLESIRFLKTKLESVPNGVFEGHPALKFIDIISNKVELKLGTHAFANLLLLEEVYLQDCGITSLPETLFYGSVNLNKIRIKGNSIKNLNSNIFSTLSSVTEILLNNNTIETLAKDAFVGLKALLFLDLSDNHLESFPSNVMYGLKNLSILALSNNRLTSVYRASYISENLYGSGGTDKLSIRLDNYKTPVRERVIEGFKFEWMPQLQKLYLNGNNIQNLYTGWSINTNITFLDLSNNEFTDMKDFELDFSKLNIVIDLEYNEIHEVKLDSRLPRRNVTSKITSDVILNNNPIDCNCNSLGLYRRASDTRFMDTEPIYHIDNVTCNSPPELTGQLLTEVSPDRLVCKISVNIDSQYFSVYVKPDTDDVVVDSSELPYHPLEDILSLSDLYEYLDMPKINVNLEKQPESIIGYDIYKLNLSNTGINNITFTPTASLKILDLSHNQLTIIPDEFLNGSVTLYVSNNPLECDCESIKQLRTPGVVADLENVTCSNGDKILEINLFELCNKTHMLIIRIGTTAVTSLFLLIIIKTLYRHRDDIRTFISTHILCRREHRHLLMNEMRLDAAKQFDLFISYAHQDEEFVSRTLVPKLENEYKQKICIHSRDWTVGDMITDQIISSVERSRRTLIVLSENFLASEWSYLEFRTAHNLSIREGRPRVIIIILDEDITSDERLGDDLKSYISVNTYLQWSDPNFWQRLKKILPRQGRK